MDILAKPAAICGLCKCSVDIRGDFVIANHDYAHRDCALVHDSRDLGAVELPERVFCWHDSQDESDFDEED